MTVLPPPCPLTVEPIDFGQVSLLIDQARKDSRRFLAARERDVPAAT